MEWSLGGAQGFTAWVREPRSLGSNFQRASGSLPSKAWALHVDHHSSIHVNTIHICVYTYIYICIYVHRLPGPREYVEQWPKGTKTCPTHRYVTHRWDQDTNQGSILWTKDFVESGAGKRCPCPRRRRHIPEVPVFQFHYGQVPKNRTIYD